MQPEHRDPGPATEWKRVMQYDYTSLRDIPTGVPMTVYMHPVHCNECSVTIMEPVFEGCATNEWKKIEGRDHRRFVFRSGNPWCWCDKTGIWVSDDGYLAPGWPVREQVSVDRKEDSDHDRSTATTL